MSYPPQGRMDITDADAAVGDVKSPKTFYAGNPPRKTGTMPTKAIVAANDNYEEGYHAGNPGGLDAIDTDLAVGNIKKDVVIFGKTGTYESTVSTTQVFGEPNAETVDPTDWKDVPGCSGTVPATAKRVECAASPCLYSTNRHTLRILYNGVIKATGEERCGVEWEGAGLGSSATLKVQTLPSTSGQSNRTAAYGWYQTVS